MVCLRREPISDVYKWSLCGIRELKGHVAMKDITAEDAERDTRASVAAQAEEDRASGPPPGRSPAASGPCNALLCHGCGRGPGPPWLEGEFDQISATMAGSQQVVIGG